MMTCSFNLIKLVTFIVNLVFCIVGLIFIGIGSYVTVSLGDYKTFLEDKIISAPIILLVTGCVIFLVSFCGCCGAKRQSTCLLKTYIFALVVVTVLAVTVGCLAAIYNEDFKDALQKALQKSLDKGEEDLDAWDALQENFECCGIHGPSDWKVIPKPESCKDYKQGCLEKLEDLVADNAKLLIGIAFGLLAIKVLGIIFASCLITGIRKKHQTY
ncbi:23 kDa integral membrane protein [Aethina tumida]|uniref:23 kDa integral membrane protein n=1 Tax=Aethina tumida TaxID=116153 RepID=UPI0021472ED8|nr:23 kDa integral membrane protein [Aethina tumida]